MLKVKITPAVKSPDNKTIQFICMSLESARRLRDTELAGMEVGSVGEIIEVVERVVEGETVVVEPAKVKKCGEDCGCA